VESTALSADVNSGLDDALEYDSASGDAARLCTTLTALSAAALAASASDWAEDGKEI
jgi:hypothetical protein